MLKWFQGALVVGLLVAAPAAAKAQGLIVEASLGKGAKVGPSPVKAEQTNLMIAPGVTIPFLRLELGLLFATPDIKDSKSNLELRPMVVISPPLFPLYGRVVFAVTNLLNGKTTVAYGGALGLSLGLGPIGIFAEAGLLPRSRESTINWVVEGRAGVYVTF
jgi:hypothetical protein